MSAPRWVAWRALWLAAGAGSGAASVTILWAWERLAIATRHLGADTPVLVPGMVFGLVVGALALAHRPAAGWHMATWGVVSTLAHHLAVKLATGFKSEAHIAVAGISAGALGAFLLGLAAVVLFRPASWVRHLMAFTVTGAVFGCLLTPALRADGWGLMTLYVPWQAAVAFVASFVFIPARCRPVVKHGGRRAEMRG